MKPRPAKRQKRHVVQSSDSEGSEHDGSRSNASVKSNLVQRASPSTRASKKQDYTFAADSFRRSRAKKGTTKQLKQTALSFSQHQVNGANAAPIQDQETTDEDLDNGIELEDDLIEDDGLDEIGVKNSTTEAPPVNTRRQQSAIPQTKLPVRKSQSNAVGTTGPIATLSSDLPWVQRCPPRGLEELGVHKKKVQDVQRWLEIALQGKARQRLLLLRGPPGSGKTATLEVLEQPLNFVLSEWRNTVDATSAMGEYTSTFTSFEEFLGRGERYGSLQFVQTSTQNGSASSSVERTGPRKVLLVEEFPSSLFGSNASLASFREIILRFLSIQPLFGGLGIDRTKHPISPPLVVVVSESTALSSGDSVDDFTAYKLLGPDILSHPAVATIDFNPVAPTLLLKVLETTLKGAASDPRERKAITQPLLKQLSSGGDIRSAIASLEFLYQARDNMPSSGVTSSTIAIGGLGQREIAVDLFHAVGKVVYNKRRKIESADASAQAFNTDHLVSDFDVQQVIDETGRDAATFVAALHENYVPSCDGDDFADCLESCISVLSDADILSIDALTAQSTGPTNTSLYNNANVDALRQTGMSTSVAVRGLLAGLPYPVNRKGSNKTSNARNAFSMFYPDSMRIRHRAAEMHDSAALALKSYRQSAISAGHSVKNVSEFMLEVVPYLAAVRRASADEMPMDSALESLVAYDTMSHPDRGTTAQDPPARNRSANKKNTQFGEQSELTTPIDEKLYLSDDDIED